VEHEGKHFLSKPQLVVFVLTSIHEQVLVSGMPMDVDVKRYFPRVQRLHDHSFGRINLWMVLVRRSGPLPVEICS
jgi:hypothetical protein